MKTGRPRIDVLGRRYGRLRVLRKAPAKTGYAFWECVCACGGRKLARASDLRAGRVKSCGCLAKEGNSNRAHGRSGTRIYAIWQSMHQRCRNPKNAGYKNYGGRGIKVCRRWHTFEKFFADMGEKPNRLTLERRDNDKGYSPSNCYWATRSEQARNTRRNRVIAVGDKALSLAAWASQLGCAPSTLYRRLEKGWLEKEACSTPVTQSSVFLSVGTLTMRLSDWAAELGIQHSALRTRLLRGWPVEAACTLPVRAMHIQEE